MSIASGIYAKKAAKQARADYQEKLGLLNNQQADEEAWFNKQYYQDITQRTDVQNMLRKLDEQQKKQQTVNDAKAAVTGATPEAKLAAQDSINKATANATAEIASDASALKDKYLSDWRNRQNEFFLQRLNMQNPETAILSNQAAMWGQAGANAFNAGGSMLGQSDISTWGKKAKTTEG